MGEVANEPPTVLLADADVLIDYVRSQRCTRARTVVICPIGVAAGELGIRQGSPLFFLRFLEWTCS